MRTCSSTRRLTAVAEPYPGAVFTAVNVSTDGQVRRPVDHGPVGENLRDERVDIMIGDSAARGRGRADELPVLGEEAARSVVLISPDGLVAWVGAGTDAGLREARTSWLDRDRR